MSYGSFDSKGTARRLKSKSIITSIVEGSLDDYISKIACLPLQSVYCSIESFRADLDQLDVVMNEFKACRSEMSSYRTSFTASMLASTFKLAQNLGSCEGVPPKILSFYACELDSLVGGCPSEVLADLCNDLLVVIHEEFMGMTGEKWAMNLLAPAKYKTVEHMSEDDRVAFLYHILAHIGELKKKYKEHRIVLWLLEGLRKSTNRGHYGFLNFPTFYKVTSKASGMLAWTILGWLVVKLGERDGLDVKLFGTGAEEWEFNEVACRLMPRFISQLTTLRSALDAQVRRVEGLQTSIRAVFLSACIASSNLFANLVLHKYILNDTD